MTSMSSNLFLGLIVMRHIVITGPGRSGTTLLVRLFRELGFETGGKVCPFFESAHAGLEDDLLDPEAPHVVKNPDLTWRLLGLLESREIDPREIEWLLVPVRQLDEAAASRVTMILKERDVDAPGGLVRTAWPTHQRRELAYAMYDLIYAAAVFELPLVILEYPRFARDIDYALRRLRPILGDRPPDEFAHAWRRVVDPDLVRSEGFMVPRHADARVAVLRFRRKVRRLLTQS
jgi:hypothetical protein